MGILRLEEMGIELEAPDNFHFYDDGKVRSLGAHLLMLRQKYKSTAMPRIVSVSCERFFEAAEPAYRKIVNRRGFHHGAGGFNHCFYSNRYKNVEDAISKGGEIDNHVCIVEDLCPTDASTIKGHELTHTILYLNGLDALKEALGTIDVDGRTLEELPLEAICQIGGFYAMVRNNPAEKEYKVLGSPYNAMMYDWLHKNSVWKGWGN